MQVTFYPPVLTYSGSNRDISASIPGTFVHVRNWGSVTAPHRFER